MSNFINNCILGVSLMSEIDDYIELWHENDSDVTLHEFLGMSKKEYALFVEDEAYLGSIISAHKNKVDIVPLMKEQLKMAARSDDPKKARQLQQWLENEKLWE